MKIGDKVFTSDLEHGTIIHIDGNYCTIRNDDGYIRKFHKNQLVIIPIPKEKTAKNCTCGANYTSFKNHHYEWCDHKKDKY